MANFTPQQIEQFLQEFFDVVGTRQYIGARYVPIFGRQGESSIAWDNTAPYEPLTIVLYQGNSYTSRQYVPAGVDILNETYWVLTGNYNSQVEAYRREVLAVAENYEVAMQTFPTVHDMTLADTLKVGTICMTQGFRAEGDGGAATYIVSASGTPNGMDVIQCGILFAHLVITQQGNPRQMGAYGDGTHDDTTYLARCLELFSFVVIPTGTYLVTSSLTTNGQTIIGNGGTLKTNSDTNIIECGSNVIIDGLKFDSDQQLSQYAVWITARSSNVAIKDCICNNMGLVRSAVLTYSTDYTDSDLCHNIIATGNTVTNSPVTAIYFSYTTDCIASANVVTDSKHGIAWWGGDANHTVDGNIANPRFARRITIGQNIVRNSAMGGIWGSMGEHVTVIGNVVDHCLDVGIDFEGTFYGQAVGNEVSNCQVGNLAIFFECKDTVFEGNTSYQDGSVSYKHIHISIPSQNAKVTSNVKIANNSFVNENDVSYIEMGPGTNEVIIENNMFQNVLLKVVGNNCGSRVIRSNNFYVYQEPSATLPYIIQVGGNRANLGVSDAIFCVMDNYIAASGDNHYNEIINCWDNNYNRASYFVIRDNIVAVAATSADRLVGVEHISTNAGIASYVTITDNVTNITTLGESVGTNTRVTVTEAGNRLPNGTLIGA